MSGGPASCEALKSRIELASPTSNSSSLVAVGAGSRAAHWGVPGGLLRLGGESSGPRWSIEIDDATRPSGHHGWYHVGALTASLPAVGDHEK